MATTITSDCIDCGLCVEACPNDAISAAARGHEIDPGRCTECVGFHSEEQCARLCPIDCCIPDPERIETEIELFERARKLHPQRAGELELGRATSRFRGVDAFATGIGKRGPTAGSQRSRAG